MRGAGSPVSSPGNVPDCPSRGALHVACKVRMARALAAAGRGRTELARKDSNNYNELRADGLRRYR